MSHHFDTKLAKEDPSLNLSDFYLFDGPSGKTVMGPSHIQGTVCTRASRSAPITRSQETPFCGHIPLGERSSSQLENHITTRVTDEHALEEYSWQQAVFF